MSYQSNNAPNDTDANGPLEFLKTVVSEGTTVDRHSNDSDKENDHRLMTISEESIEAKSSVENSKEQVQGHLSQTESFCGSDNKHSSKMAKDEENGMWEDFYNEADFTVKKDQPVFSNGVLETDHTTTFEIENHRVLDKVEEEHGELEERSQTDDYSSIFDSSVKDDEGDHGAQDSKERTQNGENKKKRQRKKRLFKRRLHSSMVSTTQTTGGSHPDLGHHDNSYQSNHLETMSESGGAGDRGRRLSRRKQVSRPRCAGPTPSGDVLQQKYQELETLVSKPLPNPAVYVQQTKQQMLRLQGLSGQYHTSNHCGNSAAVNGLPPPSGNHREEDRRQNGVIVEEISDQGYSTIRTIQVVQGGSNSSSSTRHNRPHTAHPSRRPNFGHGKIRPASAGRQRPASANHQHHENLETVSTNPQRRRGRGVQRGGIKKGRGGRSASGSGTGTRRSDSESKEYSSRDSRDSHNASSDTQDRSSSRSPSRIIQHTDTQLKHSSNPSIREWLKSKNKLERRQKSEERKKKRKERAEKQELERQKQEIFQHSDKKVKEWMVKKRKDAWKKAKEEEKKARDDEFERQGQSQYTGSLRGRSIERPQSAPSHSDRKMFVPVIRPDGDHATNNNAKDQCNGETPSPHPPMSKFVYKRPVSGRVRLMKLQQERKEDSKKLEMKKKEIDILTEEEKNRKMRMSYDQWLLKKRQENYEKRQKLAQQRALAKSDPELERIVPEVARRRIENIQRGKKPIRTNVDSIDEKMNKSFGGGDFDMEYASQNGETAEIPGLQVSGQKKSLGRRPNSATPPSTNSPLNPQISRSPRRPKSAHPRVQSCMDSSEKERVVEAKEFKLPFPPELGVPKYVAQRQEKLFSAEVITNASTSTSLPSTEAHDTESHKNLVDAQKNTSANAIISEDSQSVNLEPDKLEQQNLSTTDDLEILEHSKEDHSNEDASFFMTDGNIEIEENAEAELTEATLEETLEDEVEPGADSEINQDINELEADDNGTETKIGFEEETEEKNTSEIEEETSKAHNDQQEEDDSNEKNKEDNSFGEENEIEESQVSNVEYAAETSSPAEEPHKDTESTPQTLDDELQKKENEVVSTSSEATKGEEKTELKTETDEEEEPKSEASESKSFTKHVSFQLEAVIHEDPLAGIPPEDYEIDTEDEEAEDERGDFFGDQNEPTFGIVKYVD